jgi:hypothetical protein
LLKGAGEWRKVGRSSEGSHRELELQIDRLKINK